MKGRSEEIDRVIKEIIVEKGSVQYEKDVLKEFQQFDGRTRNAKLWQSIKRLQSCRVWLKSIAAMLLYKSSSEANEVNGRANGGETPSALQYQLHLSTRRSKTPSLENRAHDG